MITSTVSGWRRTRTHLEIQVTKQYEYAIPLRRLRTPEQREQAWRLVESKTWATAAVMGDLTRLLSEMPELRLIRGQRNLRGAG